MNEAEPIPSMKASDMSNRRDRRTESIIEALAINQSSVFSQEDGEHSVKQKPVRKDLQKKKDSPRGKPGKKLENFEIDDDWMVDEEDEEESTYRDREQPVITKLSDFDTDGFQERLKRYSSMNDVFGESQKTEYSDGNHNFRSVFLFVAGGLALVSGSCVQTYCGKRYLSVCRCPLHE